MLIAADIFTGVLRGGLGRVAQCGRQELSPVSEWWPFSTLALFLMSLSVHVPFRTPTLYTLFGWRVQPRFRDFRMTIVSSGLEQREAIVEPSR